jgi:RNA polymerase sigma factor (sigma-70 family)
MDAESSYELIRRAQDGDDAALNALIARYLPRLQRWASGRLPHYARVMTDTDDLVQDALVGTFKNLRKFEHRGEWALQAYLRQAVTNRIRDELRRAENQRHRRQDIEDLATTEASPLERALGAQIFARYDAALGQLSDIEREAVIARMELGCSYAEIATLIEKPTPDAARVMVARTLEKVATMMRQP